MSVPLGTRLGPYEILAPLGAGGMGEVYRARDTRLGREVAIKVLPSELSSDRERLSRFEQEARSASALNHPNIVTVHDVGKTDSTFYIAMELVEGKTLRELVAAEPLPIRKVLAVAPQIAEGLARAHAAGIVHRDLKPENVMVSKDGFVKILDFGLAKLVLPETGEISAMPTVGGPATQPGVMMGTVGYMSPEQARGQPVDYRTDQFSFGSILYEMVTGRRPFQGKTGPETLTAIIREEPQPIAELRPETPAPLRWIIERCLAKDPEDRYASTRDLARDLSSVRDRISEIGSGTVAPARLQRRQRLLAAGALGAALLALVASGTFLAGRRAGQGPPPSYQQLTFRRGTVWSGRFAPDGETIVYSAAWEGEPVALFSTRIGSPESRSLELPSGQILAISSSGDMALLFQPVWSLTFLQLGTLARASLAGGAPRPLLEKVHGADWSADGQTLAVLRLSGGKDRLEFPMGTVLYESDGALSDPRISPDGRRVAFFEHHAPDRAGLLVLDRRGGAPRKISEGWALWSRGLAWLPNGSEIWFTAARSHDPLSLYAATLAGRLRLVSRVPGGMILEDVDRNGRVLLANLRERMGLKSLREGEAHERELSWLNHAFLGDLSADGRVVLFHESPGGSRGAIYARETDGSPAVRLGEDVSYSTMALSPDHAWIVAKREAEPKTAVLIPAGTGEVRELAGLSNCDRLAWFPDGKRILCTKQKERLLLTHHLQTGTILTIRPGAEGPESIGSAGPVSPNGKRIPVRDSGGAIWACEADSGQCSRTQARAPGEELIGWTPDGAALLVYRRGDVPARVHRIELETGRRELWKEIAAPESGVWRIHPIRVSADCRSYAYSYSQLLSDLYLVEGLK